ncbi:MAG TPA: hypothetical protein VGM90_39020 [Kofleriaceae bacterium]
MDEAAIQLVVIVVFFGGALAMSALRVAKRRSKVTRTELARRLLRNVERRRIADLRDGQAAVIRGRARAIQNVPPIHAPMRRMPVIGVNTRLIDSEDVEILEAHACTDFELVDETGSIRVEGAGADLSIRRVPYMPFDRNAIPPAWVPVCSTMLNLSGTEGVIVDGTEVVVLGMMNMRMGATDYRDGNVERVLRAPGSIPVTISSDPDTFDPSGKSYTVEQIMKGRGR